MNFVSITSEEVRLTLDEPTAAVASLVTFGGIIERAEYARKQKVPFGVVTDVEMKAFAAAHKCLSLAAQRAVNEATERLTPPPEKRRSRKPRVGETTNEGQT